MISLVSDTDSYATGLKQWVWMKSGDSRRSPKTYSRWDRCRWWEWRGSSRVEAIGVIADDERFDRIDAEEALEILDGRGYIYTVEEAIRVTSTDG